MKFRILVISLFCLFMFSCGQKHPSIQPKTMTIGNINFNTPNGPKTGQYIFSVPNEYDSKKSWPLIVTLHGYGSNAVAFHDLWKPVTDSLGFVLLTPNGDKDIKEGFGKSWGKDAVQLVIVCIDHVKQNVNIDKQKIYLAGFSDGGRAAYLIGLKYSQLFNGIAAMSAPFDEDIFKDKLFMNKNIRILITCGELEIGLKKDSFAAKNFFQEKGFDVELREFTGVGHSLPEPKGKVLTEILNHLKND